MHVISIKPFQEASEKYPNHGNAIMDTYRVLKKAKFNSPEEMRRISPFLDNFKYENKWWIINIGGNTLRLMAYIQFSQNRIYVKKIMCHSEYDKICKKYKSGKGS